MSELNPDSYTGLEMSDPAEVLVELARRGELDPWDVDIVRTTERFLEYVESLAQRDLRIPARTLLYAAILLRMKSDAMEDQEEEEESPEASVETPEEMAYTLPQPPVRRRTRRPVTLDELIAELKKAEMIGRKRAIRQRLEEPEEEIVDLSHEEGVEDRIKMLSPVIEDMLSMKERVELKDIEGDRIMNYLALLFMAQRKQIWLEQEQLFGDLFITRPGGGM
ncbi:MAG: segregation/condensation protein A [Methanothrix sp.]|jgi:segregation and condensation protein A|uniref:segregation/condensation protein A n=1 Tax=Methanothrix sp. TaxID=90426 RepID=UPI00247EDC83|nr:segregation/condensation protein A [Methanothrix sp.]